jgi:CrcB protein
MWLVVAAAGAVGAASRAGVLEAAIALGISVPLVLVAVNVVGSGLAGTILGATATGRLATGVGTVATVGFCGGLTTLAATTTDLARALLDNRFTDALGVGAVTLGGCACMAALGWWAATRRHGDRVPAPGHTP